VTRAKEVLNEGGIVSDERFELISIKELMEKDFNTPEERAKTRKQWEIVGPKIKKMYEDLGYPERYEEIKAEWEEGM
jgi:hypothetical protein